MDELRGLRIADEPCDEVGADGAVGPPILAVRGVVGGIVGIVAGAEPRHVAQGRRLQQLSFGRANRGAEFPFGHRVKRVAGICGGGGRGEIRASRRGGERRRGGAGEHCECNDGDDCFSLYQHRTNQRFDAAAAPTVARGISAGRRKMQPGAKKAAPALTGAAIQRDPDLRTLLPARHLAVDALTNDRRRRCDWIADHRVIDVEAKWTRVGRIVQPQRDRISLNPVQVQPGRLEIQGPGTASAGRFRGRNDSRRNSSRSFIDRVLAEEGPIALLVNGMRDEWVDYVVKRKARSGRTVIVVNNNRNSKPRNSCQAGRLRRPKRWRHPRRSRNRRSRCHNW